MRHSYPILTTFPAILLLALSGCDQNGGVFPLNGKDFLSSLDGPKITGRQSNQLKAAKNAEKNNNFAKASQIYKQIIEQEPNATNVIQLLADSLRRNGEYNKSISVYNSLIEKNSSNMSAKEGKALAFLTKGDFETPTSLFEEVLNADIKRWKSLNGMGILFVTRGLYSDSLKYFKAALNQSPDNTSIMNNLGLSLALNRQYETAIDTLFKASRKSTVSSLIRKRIELNLALVYASAGDLTEAKKIAKFHLNGPALNNNLGLYAHLAKDDNLAKSYLNMALTESKTYYKKAWDNLEVLGTSNNNNTSPFRNESARITINQEPIATKSEVKSIGEITVKEIEKDKKRIESSNIITPRKFPPKAKIITIDSAINNITKDTN